MAQAYPGSSITAVSNSKTQKDFIMKRARELDINNLQVITADMVDFQVRKNKSSSSISKASGSSSSAKRGSRCMQLGLGGCIPSLYVDITAWSFLSHSPALTNRVQLQYTQPVCTATAPRLRAVDWEQQLVCGNRSTEAAMPLQHSPGDQAQQC